MAKENNGQQATEWISAEKANTVSTYYNYYTTKLTIDVSIQTKELKSHYFDDRTTIIKEKTIELSDEMIANMQHGMEAYKLSVEEVVEDLLLQNSDLITKYVTGETENLTLTPVEDNFYNLSKYLLEN